MTRARRWDLAAGTERTTYGTASSVNGAHPTRAPEFDITYQYDGGTRVIKSVARSSTGATKYTVYPFSTLEMRGTTLTGSGTAQDYALNTETTQIRLGAGAVSGRVLYNATMPRTGTSQVHLFLEFGDHLGSASFTIDHATSEVVEYISYTAYGQTENDYRTSRWSNFREPYRFTGKEEDTEVGLNYHGARYYSPSLKRWMSADPVTTHEAGSDINPYSYGYGNPTSYVDPDGREPLSILAIVVISAVVAGATSATVQYATTGHVDWGWKGVGGAALSGAVGAAVGMGVGALASPLGPLAAGAIGGAAGGAASGATGTALAGGSASDIGKSALIGGVSGAVGGAVGVAAGSTNVGTGAGTGAGIVFGWAAFGQDPTWQSAGIAFASAFAGTIASTALSKGYQAAAEQNTAGRAAEAGQSAGQSAQRNSDATSRLMTEKYTAELGARIAALPDYRTADIWLEGASPGEPELHLSVSIGDPNGAYESFSFGVGGLGADFGKVYPDKNGPGQILQYIKTDANQDAQALRYIREQWQADSRPTYGAEICRSYAIEKMRIFKIMFGNPTSIPAGIQRPMLPPPSQPWWTRLANWVSGRASSAGTGTSQ